MDAKFHYIHTLLHGEALRQLLRIVETLTQFITTLFDQKLIIYTDHKHITCKCFNNYRLLKWRLILEDYGPDIEYIKGEKNIGYDALSRITLNRNEDTTYKFTYQREVLS